MIGFGGPKAPPARSQPPAACALHSSTNGSRANGNLSNVVVRHFVCSLASKCGPPESGHPRRWVLASAGDGDRDENALCSYLCAALPLIGSTAAAQQRSTSTTEARVQVTVRANPRYSTGAHLLWTRPATGDVALWSTDSAGGAASKVVAAPGRDAK